MVKMVALMLVTYLICDGMPYVHFYFEMYNHGLSLNSISNNSNKNKNNNNNNSDKVYAV